MPEIFAQHVSGFEREAPRLIKEAEKAGAPLFVLFIDMDGLKTVNDTMGHDQGDAYIMEVTTILRKIHKRGELLMRYGGDEFVVLARGYSEEEAENYCEAIREAEEEANQKGLPFRVSISTGYVRKKAEKGFSLEEAIEEADQRMYADKQKRKQGRE